MTDALQDRLGIMLRGLANQAPQGPSAASVTARLARRTLGRWIAATLSLVLVALCATTGAWQAGAFGAPTPEKPASAPMPPQMPAAPKLPPVTPNPEPAAPQVLKPRVAPLGPQADHVEMGEALAAFFATCGADRALIVKDGATQLSFSLNTRDDESLAQIRTDIETLLANYDRAEVTLRNGRLSYSLLASGRP